MWSMLIKPDQDTVGQGMAVWGLIKGSLTPKKTAQLLLAQLKLIGFLVLSTRLCHSSLLSQYGISKFG